MKRIAILSIVLIAVIWIADVIHRLYWKLNVKFPMNTDGYHFMHRGRCYDK